MYATGQLGPPNLRRAIEFFERGCKLGESEACDDLERAREPTEEPANILRDGLIPLL
jgi:TPR repeat protein